MTNIDQFESVFKAADKPAFVPEQVAVNSVLVITTLERAGAKAFQDHAQGLLAASIGAGEFKPTLVCDDDFTEVSELLAKVQETSPDLICTYRNLKRPARDYPFSLGVFVDVLTQATDVPVLLLPAPRPDAAASSSPPTRVMAITDHLAGDHHLVSFAAELTEPGGELWLSHVEDETTFARLIQTISKIPTIEPDSARDAILEQLLKEPKDYIASCREVLATSASHLTVQESITLGHHLTDYKRLVEEHEVELVVMNTKDEDQLAMHGLAYPLAVELRQTPLLLL